MRAQNGLFSTGDRTPDVMGWWVMRREAWAGTPRPQAPRRCGSHVGREEHACPGAAEAGQPETAGCPLEVRSRSGCWEGAMGSWGQEVCPLPPRLVLVPRKGTEVSSPLQLAVSPAGVGPPRSPACTATAPLQPTRNPWSVPAVLLGHNESFRKRHPAARYHFLQLWGPAAFLFSPFRVLVEHWLCCVRAVGVEGNRGDWHCSWHYSLGQTFGP